MTDSIPAYPPMRFQLQTDRLTLRPWAFSDVADYQALVTERGDRTPTVADIRERITTQLAATAPSGIALLPIQRRVEGDFIGYCGLISTRENLAEPEIAYELVRRAHGHGYATEAGHAVIDAATATGRTRLWSAARTWNTASLRVLEKLGFEREDVTDAKEWSAVIVAVVAIIGAAIGAAVSSWLGARHAVSQDMREHRLTSDPSVWSPHVGRLPLARDDGPHRESPCSARRSANLVLHGRRPVPVRERAHPLRTSAGVARAHRRSRRRQRRRR